MPNADKNNSNKRPAVAIALVAILLWLGCSGIGNAFVWRGVPEQVAGQIPAEYLPLIEAMASTTFSAVSLLYALTAFTAAVGIWRLTRWKSAAFAAWSIVVVTTTIWMLVAIAPVLHSVAVPAAFVLVPVVALLGFGYWLVNKLPVRPASPA